MNMNNLDQSRKYDAMRKQVEQDLRMYDTLGMLTMAVVGFLALWVLIIIATA